MRFFFFLLNYQQLSTTIMEEMRFEASTKNRMVVQACLVDSPVGNLYCRLNSEKIEKILVVLDRLVQIEGRVTWGWVV